jgi:pyruvate dehydrogenase E1 component
MPWGEDTALAERQDTRSETLALLAELERKIAWLSAWMIHHANHIRENRDGLKVGGHQASCASMTTIMAALYFDALRPQDRVAVKPHAAPVFHAIQYLYGRQSREALQRFRALGGAQSYPSRTKDADDVDFSTGSVGLGVAITSFASLAQDYLQAKGAWSPEQTGRMIALLGDAELDEGNVYEALLEGAKHALRNVWWVIDYNRQSLDAVTSEGMAERYRAIFEACGWDVVTLKYGKRLLAAFAEPGGAGLRAWIEAAPNDLYSALTFQGGAAWRARLSAELPAESAGLLAGYDDAALHALMTNLGGHDLESLREAFAQAAAHERPVCFIAYTIKGLGLPFEGHKDNHSGLMTPAQMEVFQARHGVEAGQEWEPFAGLPRPAAAYEAFLRGTAWAGDIPGMQPGLRRFAAAPVPVPALPAPAGKQSTQVAFGKLLNDLARTGGPLADALLTTSPDVTVSTNLGGFVNQRGLFARAASADLFKDAGIPSPQKWAKGPAGQHLELGIAEHNLFLALAAFGLTAPLFGRRLIPIGTLYDPFINRGLDALNYACYQDARFIVVATPSGVTLAPEGGAHQSIQPPVIGMAQPGLTYFEPAFAEELALILHWGFAHLQEEDGGSLYLRLSTRALDQPAPLTPAQADGVVEGGYWRRPPAPGAELAIAYAGALAPEAEAAWAQLAEETGAGLLAVTSPDRLHRDWRAAQAARARGERGAAAPVERLLGALPAGAGLISVFDGAPGALSWLGSVQGHRVAALGLDAFGQSGDIPDLYRISRLDEDAILHAAAGLLLRGG